MHAYGGPESPRIHGSTHPKLGSGILELQRQTLRPAASNTLPTLQHVVKSVLKATPAPPCPGSKGRGQKLEEKLKELPALGS